MTTATFISRDGITAAGAWPRFLGELAAFAAAHPDPACSLDFHYPGTFVYAAPLTNRTVRVAVVTGTMIVQRDAPMTTDKAFVVALMDRVRADSRVTPDLAGELDRLRDGES